MDGLSDDCRLEAPKQSIQRWSLMLVVKIGKLILYTTQVILHCYVCSMMQVVNVRWNRIMNVILRACVF